MKINFINLFGLGVKKKKIIFKVLQCKTKENGIK